MNKTIKFKMFILENKVMLGLLLLSILVIVKGLQSPYQSGFDFTLKQIKGISSSNIKIYNILSVAENFSILFIVGFLFYILVNYIPQLQKEDKAYSLIKYDLMMLDIEIVKFLAFFAYGCDVKKRLLSLSDEDIKSLDIVELNNINCDYHYIIWDISTNKIISKGERVSINYYQELVTYSIKIQEIVNKIMHKPFAAYYSKDLLEIFKVISENELFSIANNKRLGLKYNSEYIVAVSNVKTNFLEAFKVVSYFKNYNFNKIDYEIKEINKK